MRRLALPLGPLLAAALALLAPSPAALAAEARPKVCLVLSGGGARGVAHVGVLQVLEELRVPVDCVVGTSMGALVGAAYASGVSPARIEEAVRGADWGRLLSDQPERGERSVYAKQADRDGFGGVEVGLRERSLQLPAGVLVGQQLQFFLTDLVGTTNPSSFDDLPIPYRAIATDFETGGMVVMAGGDLATAMRASMSVPGAFAPVERDGRILVDGGLVRNLGVDVARGLGAEVVIAVNLGTPLLPRAKLSSVFSVAEQTINILTEQNVARSLGELGEEDVLILPELGDFSSADFAGSTKAVPFGRAAALAVADRLARLSVDEAEFARWRAAVDRQPSPGRVARVEVDTSGLRHANPESVRAVFAGVRELEDVERGLNALLGMDDFERVEAQYGPGAEGTTLVLRPVEKSWGPNYLRGGIRLETDLAGRSDFTVGLDSRMTWLTPAGLEWRNRLTLGRLTGLASELRQPLDVARSWFVAPALEATWKERDLWLDGNAVASIRERRTFASVDLGRRVGNRGEARLGFEVGEASERLVTGSVPQARSGITGIDRRITALRANAVLDRLDNLDFPQRGYLVDLDARFGRRALGGDDAYDRVSLGVQWARGAGDASVELAARHVTSLGGPLPFYDAYGLGGFLYLSGLQRDQIVASQATFGRLVYRHRVAAYAGVLPGLYVGASVEGADVREPLNGFPEGFVGAGSVFLSAESVLGPFYLGFGAAEGGWTSLYLYVGRPW